MLLLLAFFMMSFLSSTAWPRLLLKEPFDGSEAEAEKYIFGTMHFERRPWDYYYTCVFSAAVMHFKVKDTVMPSINNQKCSWAMPCIIFAWLLPRRHYFIYMRNRPCKHIFSQVLHFCISSSNADFFFFTLAEERSIFNYTWKYLFDYSDVSDCITTFEGIQYSWFWNLKNVFSN